MQKQGNNSVNNSNDENIPIITAEEQHLTKTLDKLQEMMNANISYIGILRSKGVIETLCIKSIYRNLNKLSFSIINTPERDVVKNQIIAIKDNILQTYTELSIIFSKEIKSYLGIPLLNSQNKVNGVLGFYFNSAQNSFPVSKKTLKILSLQLGFTLENHLLTKHSIGENINFSIPEKCLANIANNIQDILISIDRDYRITLINRPYLNIEPEAIIGHKITDLNWSPTFSCFSIDFINHTIDTGKTTSFEKKVYTSNGIENIFRITHSPLYSNNRIDRIILTISDLTKVKQLEEQIYDSEQRYHNFINFSQEGIFLFELKKKLDTNINKNDQLEHLLRYLFLSECNFAFAQTYGYQTNTQPKGKSIIEFFGSKKRALEIIQRFLDNNYFFPDIETIEISADGAKHIMINNIFGVLKDNYLIEIWGTQKDITHKKVQEKALKESFIKFKTLAEYTYDWEYWRNENKEYIYISPSCERISGYKPSEFKDDTSLLNKIIHKDDRHIWRTHLDTVSNRAPCKEPIEFRINTRDGKTKWINHVCRPVFDNEGNYLGNRGTNRDITIQKLSQQALLESEMHFRELADLTFEGIIIHKKGIPQRINKALQEMTGYSIKDLYSKDLLNLLIPNINQAQLLINDKSMRTQPMEIEIKAKNGALILSEVISQSISKSDNELRAISIRDITEQKQIQQKILNAIIQTEEKERKWIAQELHDGLGPLLSTIKLNFQTYFNTDNESFKDRLKIQALNDINDALQQTSMISNNISPHVLNDFGLKVAIQKFIEKFIGSSINIKYEFDYLPDIDKEIEITLYRVSTELLNNTLKHANASKIQISILGNESSIKLLYSDNGKGFDLKDKREKGGGMGIFNIFNRIKSLNGKVYFSNNTPHGISYDISIPAKIYIR